MPQKTIDAAAGLAGLVLLAIVALTKPPQVVEIAATADALQLVPDGYTMACGTDDDSRAIQRVIDIAAAHHQDAGTNVWFPQQICFGAP